MYRDYLQSKLLKYGPVYKYNTKNKTEFTKNVYLTVPVTIFINIFMLYIYVCFFGHN
jgi:hypothetical protein